MLKTTKYYTLDCEDNDYQILRYTSVVCGCSGGGNCFPNEIALTEDFFPFERLPKSEEDIDNLDLLWCTLEIENIDLQLLFEMFLERGVVNKDIQELF